jgi:phospholipase C
VPIDHVVVLLLENRSFDHMLGFLDHPDPEFEGLTRDGPFDSPGWDNGPRVAATPDAKRVLPFGPDHSHDAVMEQLAVTDSGAGRMATNQGYVTSYERKVRGMAPATFGGILGPLLNRLFGRKPGSGPVAEGRGPLVMRCQSERNVPVLATLAREFAVCDRWFCSVPGETWPNRNFLHAATSDGLTNIEVRPYTNRTIFELIEEHGASWRIYHDDTPQVWAFPRLWDTPRRHGNWFPVAKFGVHATAGDLAAYSFLEPNHRPPVHTVPVDPAARGLGSSQHPDNNRIANDAYDTYPDTADTDFARGEALVASVYEALRANPDLFNRTMLVISYDEAGGLYDHVPPPTGVPNPGTPPSRLGRVFKFLWHRNAAVFDFTMLGPRVPAVIVSPLVPAGTVDHRTHEHASVPATVRALFAPAAPPLTARDGWAVPFHDLATLDQPRTDLPDLSAHARRAAEALPPTVTEEATLTGPVPQTRADIPDYYQDFIAQAEQVRAHLDRLGEPEIASVPPATPRLAAEVTLAFAKAAHRHRHAPGAGQPE